MIGGDATFEHPAFDILARLGHLGVPSNSNDGVSMVLILEPSKPPFIHTSPTRGSPCNHFDGSKTLINATYVVPGLPKRHGDEEDKVVYAWLVRKPIRINSFLLAIKGFWKNRMPSSSRGEPIATLNMIIRVAKL